jgi:hypothetical protein
MYLPPRRKLTQPYAIINPRSLSIVFPLLPKTKVGYHQITAVPHNNQELNHSRDIAKNGKINRFFQGGQTVDFRTGRGPIPFLPRMW